MAREQINQLSAEQLREREQELRGQVLTMRFERAAGRLLNTAACGQRRKELARVLTRLGELSRQAVTGQQQSSPVEGV
ncbi:MAG: 50S ribosomal protein L29 [Myxococcota bacterium]